MASGKRGPGTASRKGRTAGRAHGHSVRQVEESARYTRPTPSSVRRSPRWMGVLILLLFLGGGALIIINYVIGQGSGWYIAGGAVAIVAGLIVALNYR